MNLLENFNIFNYKIRGDVTSNLKDCIKNSSTFRKIFIGSYLNTALNMEKKSYSNDKDLEKGIIAACKVLVNTPFIYQKEFESIKEKNSEWNEILESLGMQYCFENNGQDVYVVPQEIIKLFKDTVTEEYKQKQKEEIINRSIDIVFYAFGVIEKDKLKEWLEFLFPDDDLDIEKLLANKYFIEGNLWMVNYLKDKKDYVETVIHKPCGLKENMIYYLLINNYYQIYTDFVAKLNKLGYAGEKILFDILASDDKKNIPNELDDLYHFNEQAQKIVKQFLKQIDELNLWKYRGLGASFFNSQKCLKNVQVKKTMETENISLITCLNNMLPRNYIELVKRLKLKSNVKVETVAKRIMKNMDKYLELLREEDVEKILDFDNLYIPLLAEKGFVFSKVNYDYLEPFFPTEIEEALDSFVDENNFEDIIDNFVMNLIDEYMNLNGLLLKTKLQELLKDNYGMDYDIESLDSLMDAYYMTNTFYSKCEFTEEDCQKFYKVKEKFGDFCKLSKEKIQVEEQLISEIADILHPVIDEIKSSQFISNLLFGLKMNMYNKMILDMTLEEENIKLSPDKIEKIHKIITRYKDDIGLWLKNGYSQNEIKQRNKLKVGRNDLCPCGSGKKYKKCCGK